MMTLSLILAPVPVLALGAGAAGLGATTALGTAAWWAHTEGTLSALAP
jgi:hypothetical protein